MSKAPTSLNEGVPAEVHPVMTMVLQKFKNLKNMQLRLLIADVITFVSIIGAYYCMSLSFENESIIEELIGFKFSNYKTQSGILLIFALYLIGLKLLHEIAYKYETAPAKKAEPKNWQQAEQPIMKSKQSTSEQHLPKPLPADSYSSMISCLIRYSVYGIVLILCTTSYTFYSVFNKEKKLVQLQQINYLMMWFVGACVFYSLGKILGKMTKINAFHHFGLTIAAIVVIMEIGLSHGFNMFVFI